MGEQELLTPSQMAKADQLTIATGTTGAELMERAGAAIVQRVVSLADLDMPVKIFAGPGNNGGDGFVVARLLTEIGYDVEIALLGDKQHIAGDAALAAQKWQKKIHGVADLDLSTPCLIIDALFGAGLSRPLNAAAADLVNTINEANHPVIAVDLPSGINGATGACETVAIKASETITFFRAKPGHHILPGRAHCGELYIADIGIAQSVLSEINPQAWQNTPSLWQPNWPTPKIDGHKFTRGHVVALSGPLSKTGAARLAAMAALRAGAGLVTIASSSSAMLVNANHLTAIMLAKVNTAQDFAAILNDTRMNSTVIGPGCGVGQGTADKTCAALAAGCACVLDADALTSFVDDRGLLVEAISADPSRPVVFTPHSGEFARLFPELTGHDKLEQARAAAQIVGGTVVLKGADTIIAAANGRAAINTNAPPWLATAGSGDVLAGFIAGLLAQGMPGFEAAAMGVWLHGEAGSRAGIGLIAEDLPAQIPAILRQLIA